MKSAAMNRKLGHEGEQRIIIEGDSSVGAMEDMAALMLDDRGMIRDCNQASETLFEYRRSELVWRHVSMLLPQLAGLELMQNGQPNSRLCFLCHTGRRFEAVTQSGGRFASELFLNCLDNTGQVGVSLIVRSIVEETSGGGFICAARRRH